MEEIIVTGGYAVLRSVQEIKRVKTDDLLSSVAATAGVTTPLLPENALLFACKGMRKVMATCRKPDKTAFKVKNVNGVETLEIAHPWLFFIHVFEGMAYGDLYVLGASRRIQHESEPLFKLPFRNLYASGKVCMGRDLKFDLQGPFASKAEAAERHFFESVFNGDLDPHARSAMPEGWDLEAGQNAMQLWAQKSESASFKPLEILWRESASFKDMLDTIIGRGKQ